MTDWSLRQLVARLSLRQAASVLLSVGLLLALVVVLNPRDITAALTDADVGWYLLGGVVYLIAHFFASERWIHLLRTVDCDPAHWVAYEVLLTSYGLNHILPANAGDITRFKIMEQYHSIPSYPKLAALVVVERLFDLLVVTVLFLVGSLAVTTQLVSEAVYAILFVVAVGTTALLGALWRYDVVRFGDRLPSRVTTVILSGVQTIRTLPAETVRTVAGYSVVRWLLTCGAFFIVGHSLTDGVTVLLAVALVASLSIGAVLPLTPGGIGIGETLGVGVLIAGGVDSATAVTLTLFQRSYSLLWVAAPGFVLTAGRGIRR